MLNTAFCSSKTLERPNSRQNSRLMLVRAASAPRRTLTRLKCPAFKVKLIFLQK